MSLVALQTVCGFFNEPRNILKENIVTLREEAHNLASSSEKFKKSNRS